MDEGKEGKGDVFVLKERKKVGGGGMKREKEGGEENGR